MPRIIGVEVPNEKKVGTALTYIYGIGPVSALRILKAANIDSDTRAKNLTGDDISRLSGVISKQYKVEGELRQEVSQYIKRLVDTGTFRGIRHRRGLPVRGQRTHTNARTRKGPKGKIGGNRPGVRRPVVVKKPAGKK